LVLSKLDTTNHLRIDKVRSNLYQNQRSFRLKAIIHTVRETQPTTCSSQNGWQKVASLVEVDM